MKTLTEALRSVEQVHSIPTLLELTAATLEAAARLMATSYPPSNGAIKTLACAAHLIYRLRDEIFAGDIQP